MATFEKLPQAKLRDFEGSQITIKKIVTGTSKFGPYVLLITATHSIISSHKVVLKQAAELQANLPVTMTVTKKDGVNGGNPYFVLE